MNDDELSKLFKSNLEKYERIREGIMFCFKKYGIVPIIIHKFANELDTIAIKEYQTYILGFVTAKARTFSSGVVNEYVWQFDINKWANIFDKDSDMVKDCWHKIIGIFAQENIKPLELYRISAELRTSALEQFIHVIGGVIEETFTKPKIIT